MATFSTSVNEITITPRTHNKIDITFNIDNSIIYELFESMIDYLPSNDKQDLFDKLKDEGYGNE